MLRSRMAMDIFDDINIDIYDPFKEKKMRKILNEEIKDMINQQIVIAGAMDPKPDMLEDIFKMPGQVFGPIAY